MERTRRRMRKYNRKERERIGRIMWKECRGKKGKGWEGWKRRGREREKR